MRGRSARTLFLVVLGMMVLSPAAAQQTFLVANAAIKEYTIPTNASRPFDIVVGPDRNLWFTEWLGGKIGRISPATGAVTEYSPPPPHSGPRSITSGPDGNLWFTEWGYHDGSIFGGKIGRINPTTGAIAEYPLTPPHPPEGITAGPDGNLWFTRPSDISPEGKIGRINPSTGDITEYPVPYVTRKIVTGPDRSLWFTESLRIGRFDPMTGAVAEYPVPTATRASGPDNLIVGPDSALWLTWSEAESFKIGRINPTTGNITAEYSIPGNRGGDLGDVSAGLTVGPDGNLWVAMVTINVRLLRPVGGKIYRITPTGIIAMYPLPQNTDPHAIVAGPDGNLWFTVFLNNKIGRITPLG